MQTCWEIGRHIVEFEQQGEARAKYGKGLLADLSKQLTQEFGRGFDSSNLRYMQLFYLAFPIRDALRHELSWTHYHTLLKVESSAAREWCIAQSVQENWSTRALERQISTIYYLPETDRLLESELDQGLMNKLQSFLLELGNGFTFVGRR